MLEWAYHGVNISVPRNGGKECAEFLSTRQRILETAGVLLISLPLLHWSLRSLSPLKAIDYCKQKEPLGKRVLLVLLCLIWGVEIGFKFSSRAVIFLLNPCHVTTALQIYLLAAPPSKTSSAVFRFQLNCMNGPILAVAFPELDALNGIGMPAQVNLNHMLCPAIRDPFDGVFYRPIAVVHQAILCPSLSKLFAYLGNYMKVHYKIN